MSKVNQTPQRGRVTRLRIVIATSVASILLGSSFYAAQAGGGNNGGYSDRLDGLEIAAIASGAVGGGLIIASIMRGRGNRDEEASESKEKTAKAGAVKEVRVRSSQSSLTAGDTATVQVEARYQGSESWQNVTNESQVRLLSGGLAQIDGSKNAFAVPYGSQVAAGPATIEASFGGRSATTSVSVN